MRALERHRDLIVRLAAGGASFPPSTYAESFRYRRRAYVFSEPDRIDQFRGAADYVDKILNGARPADLPVEGAEEYQLVVNLRSAAALGLDHPALLLARADEVIE